MEMRTVCGSCVTGEHMCGGDCDCMCDFGRSEAEVAELNWTAFQEEESTDE